MTDKQKVIELCIQFLGCKKEEVSIYEDRLQGRSNRLFLVEIKNKLYTIRIPGDKSEIFIENRQFEANMFFTLEKYNMTSKTLFYNENGIKISEYIDGNVLSTIPMNLYLKDVAKELKKLHDLKIDLLPFHPIDEINRLRSLFNEEEVNIEYKELLDEVKKEYSKLNHQSSVIHGDFNPDNVIVTKDKKIQFIDFEYATLFDPLYDIASFMSYSEELMLELLTNYPHLGSKEEAYKKIIYYRVLQTLRWHNVALLKDKLNLGMALVIDFKGISNYMLKQAILLWKKYKELP